MKEQLIELPTAILAYQKAFKEECDNFFNEGDGFKPQSSLIRTGEGIFYERPTQSQLQTWLREKWNIHIFINPIWNDDLLTVKEYWQTIISPLIKDNGTDTTIQYLTYESSLEAALLFSLNLIEL